MAACLASAFLSTCCCRYRCAHHYRGKLELQHSHSTLSPPSRWVGVQQVSSAQGGSRRTRQHHRLVRRRPNARRQLLPLPSGWYLTCANSPLPALPAELVVFDSAVPRALSVVLAFLPPETEPPGRVLGETKLASAIGAAASLDLNSSVCPTGTST